MQFIGIYDRRGHLVSCKDEYEWPLPFNLHYTDTRDWHTDAGLRQLALDILIYALGEQPSPALLLPRDDFDPLDPIYADDVAAWLPHLHYAQVLAQIARAEGHSHWVIEQRQVLTWLYDWMAEQHLKYSARRYPRYYAGMTFADWTIVFREQMARFGAYDLDALNLGRPMQFKFYLAGWMPHDVVVTWCERLFTMRAAHDHQEAKNLRRVQVLERE